MILYSFSDTSDCADSYGFRDPNSYRDLEFEIGDDLWQPPIELEFMIELEKKDSFR